MRNIITLLPLFAAMTSLFACGAGGQNAERSGSDSAKSTPKLMEAIVDVAQAGFPSIVRLTAPLDAPHSQLSWELSHGTIIDSTEDNSEIWVRFDKPGTAVARLRGIEVVGLWHGGYRAMGTVDIRNGANAAPVGIVIDFPSAGVKAGGATLSLGESLVLDGSQSYDPEGYADRDNGSPAIDERGIASYEWSLYRANDSDLDHNDLVLRRTGGIKMEVEVIEFGRQIKPDSDGNYAIDLDGDGVADILLIDALFNPSELTVKRVTPQTAGTYVFELSVTDSAGQTGISDTKVNLTWSTN